MIPHFAAGTILLSLGSLAAPSAAGRGPLEGEPTDPEACGTPDDGSLPTFPIGLASSPAPVDVLMVCVTFPNVAPENGIPSWLPGMAGEGVEGALEAYMRIVSEGKHSLAIDFERRPPPFDNDPFLVSQDDTYYQGISNGYGMANQEVVDQIVANHGGDPTYLDAYDGLIFVYNGDPFFANIGGIAGVGIPGRIGYSARLLTPGVSIDGNPNRRHSEWVAVHEYGHLLGLFHTARSAGTCVKKQGRYAPMQSQVPRSEERGYHPYHLTSLIRLGWFDRVVTQPALPGQSLSFTLQDARRGGAALLVSVLDWNGGAVREYFLISNHQGSDYDAAYPGSGLLIWHVLDDRSGSKTTIDLEVPTGLFDALGNPDPVSGTDTLDDAGMALSTDFWQSGVLDEFSNPNTSRYQPVDCPLQKSASGLQVTNIVQGASDVSFQVAFAAPPPWVSASVVVPPETFLGLDCNAAHTLRAPLLAYVTDPDGTPLSGIPMAWMSFELASLSPGALDFCGGSTRAADWLTGSSGDVTSTLYHACGGGLYEASLDLLGETAGTSLPVKLRTPDLNADGFVDDVDVTVWQQGPSGTPEDDIRDLDFDLDVDVSDLALLAQQLETGLEGDLTVELLSPAAGAQLAIGSIVALEAAACASDGSQPTTAFVRTNLSNYLVLGFGPSFSWLVAPPAESTHVLTIATNAGLVATTFTAIEVRPPALDLVKLGSSPAVLSIGSTGKVRFRLKNMDSVALSSLEAGVAFPGGQLVVVSGPLPSNPQALAPGQSVDLEWTVQRVSGSGSVQVDVSVLLEGHPEVLHAESFTVYGPSGSGGL